MSDALTSFRALAAVRGVPVTYSDGSGVAPITAVRGQSVFEVPASAEAIVAISTRDYLVAAEDLVIDSQAVEPEKSHTIADSGTTYKLRVPNGVKVFDYSDADKTVVRIHTVES